MSDENTQLVDKAKQGDQNAYGQLYLHFLPRIYRFVFHLVWDEHLAEDITQEAFLKAWRSLDRFSAKKGTFQAYLYMIARNTVIDHQRKRKPFNFGMDFVEMFSSNEDLEENYSRSEEARELKAVLDDLPQLSKQLIILRYFEELSFSAIAQIVKKKEGAVRVRVHRILETLKNNIKQ